MIDSRLANGRASRYFVAACLTTALAVAAGVSVLTAGDGVQGEQGRDGGGGRRARNVIFFVGDGMGVSTVTATRVFAVGVGGQLVVDQFPYTALSRTYSTDAITADSAPTMTAMMTGRNTNQTVIGLDERSEVGDFNKDGDGEKLVTVLEQAKGRGMKVGVVSTARITHATPAATYAHINNRDLENDIARQALPTDALYNTRLGDGIDVLLGGGRSFFVPSTVRDEEGGLGSRPDGRDLRTEFQKAGYTYVWNTSGFSTLTKKSLPVLGLFERSHMEYEYDRPSDQGGEPSLTDMTVKAVELLRGDRRGGDKGFFLMVEGGRIDHAHHEGNAIRALTDMNELDKAIGAAARMVDLRETLIIVSADHSHVFNIAGYPMRPANELPYRFASAPPEFSTLAGNGILDVAYDMDAKGVITKATDRDGVPYTVLGYLNGPGYRGKARVDPWTDTTLGRGGVVPKGPADQAYYQEAAVPMGSETHAGEEVAIYAIGPGSQLVRGTVKNTHIADVMRSALGLATP